MRTRRPTRSPVRLPRQVDLDPAQTEIANHVFALSDETIARAITHARSYQAAERAGRGAVMLDGKMADRATDRVHRTVLRAARAMGKLAPEVAEELGID